MRLLVLGGTRSLGRHVVDAALGGSGLRRPQAVVDTSCQSRAAADQAATTLADVGARDLAARLVRGVEEGWSGPVNATGPVGTTTLGGLLATCAAAVGTSPEWVPVPEEQLLDAGVEPWQHLPHWLPRGVEQSVADTWAWLRDTGGLDAPPTPPRGLPAPGLPVELEQRLLAGVR